jgi:hypothetical protein
MIRQGRLNLDRCTVQADRRYAMELEDPMELMLDQALELTFPASDPLSLATAAERADRQQPVKDHAHEDQDTMYRGKPNEA